MSMPKAVWRQSPASWHWEFLVQHPDGSFRVQASISDEVLQLADTRMRDACFADMLTNLPADWMAAALMAPWLGAAR